MSTASSRSDCITCFLPFLTAPKAASLTMFASSAPDAPDVILAMIFISISVDSFIFLACNSKIASLPFRSGSSTGILLSNLPGLSRAGSRVSGRLVAARITTPLVASKPSISVSSWLSVCSLSSFPPIPDPESLFFPIVSISSIKTIQGAFSPACLKRSRTLLAPIPTNISTNSLPAIEKKGTPASPATAFASNVLPVPGEPTRRAPFGIFAPISVYF